MESARLQMPWTYSMIMNTSKPGVKYEKNKRALVISALLDTWIPRSNFVYRINTLLTTGSCKNEVIDLFHRLGLSSHSCTIRRQVKAAARHYDPEIMVWKKTIERNRKNYILLQEALSSQIPAWDDVNTVISSASVDFSHDVAKSYRHFDEETYKSCLEPLPKNDDEVMQYDYSDLIATAKTLKEEKLPLYRCAEIILQ